MASLSGVVNHQHFTDLGFLFSGGRLYTYLPGTTTHTNVFTDSGGVTPHTYTSDGGGGQFIELNSRGEVPGNIYVPSGGVDFTLKTAAGATVWTKRAIGSADASTTIDTAVRADFASTADVSKGDALVGVKRTESGAVAKTLHTWTMERPLSVKDMGATGDGVTNDAAAVAAAFAVSKHVLFPQGTYNFGSFGSADVMNSIDGSAGMVSIQTEGLVKLICQSTANVIPIFFNITNAKGVRIGNLNFEDSGYNGAVEWRGAGGVKLTASVGNPVTDVVIDSLRCKNLVYPLVCVGVTTTRISGVHVKSIYAEDTYYGVNLQNNGDNVVIDSLVTSGVNRSALIYGVEGFKANIFSKSPNNASVDCYIQAHASGYDTTDVDIKYSTRNASNANILVGMDIFGEGSRRIENVRLDLDIDSSVSGTHAVAMKAWDAAGAVENTGATNNVWDAVNMRGRIALTGAGNHAIIYCQPSTKGSIHLGDNIDNSKLTGILTYFNAYPGIFPNTTFTPTIKGQTSAGSGTYTTQSGRFQLVGNRCFFELSVVWTAHTGTGNMLVDGLPYTAHASAITAPLAIVYDAIAVASGKELGAAIFPGSTQIRMYAMDQAGGILNQLAIEGAGGLYLSGHFEIA